MTISNQQLATKINQRLATALTPSATDKITAAAASLQTVVSVPNFQSLPAADQNTGRMIYVESLGEYYYSDGDRWTADFSTAASGFQIWAWGSNICGLLGDGTVTGRLSPVSVIGGFTDWCGISAGGHSLALRANGTVWSWGCNGSGRLGDGTATARSSPVSVVGGFTDWSQISGGDSHSLAIRANGTLWSWGDNGCGRLGDGTTDTRFSPVSVVGGFTDWSQISAGCLHNLALRSNGTLWSWGANGLGQLGDGTFNTRLAPVSVVGGFTDWSQISVGGYHSLALRTNGTLWSWGSNSNGRLGDGTGSFRTSPVSVIGGFTDWCAVAAGGNHSLGLRSNGTLWSWGSNFRGQLGHNTDSTCSRSSPVSVIGGFTDWCAVSAGDYNSSLALRTDGTLWSWGSNSSGQLGDGTGFNRSSPVSVVGFINVCAVSAGKDHSAALGAVRGF